MKEDVPPVYVVLPVPPVPTVPTGRQGHGDTYIVPTCPHRKQRKTGILGCISRRQGHRDSRDRYPPAELFRLLQIVLRRPGWMLRNDHRRALLNMAARITKPFRMARCHVSNRPHTRAERK